MKGFTVFAIFLLTMIQNGLAQFAGATFEDRKRAYINDQGRKWAYAFPAAMKQGLFAWLERPDQGNNRSLISEEIDYLTKDDDCRARGGNFWWPWKNCWWTGDHPTPLIASRVLYQYGNVISNTDKQKIQDQLRIIAFTPGVWCANYNYHVCYIIPAYLYVHYVENIGMIEFPSPDPQYHCPPSFSYNGNSYVGGKSYPARQIYRDYLYYLLDEWQKKGTLEDISTSYYEIPVLAIALLQDFAPDAELRKRAKMHLDWLIFNYAVSFSAKTPSGGSGRTYTEQHLKGMFWFPWGQFFRFDQQTIDMITEGRVFTDHYVSKYRHPQLMTEIVESINGVNQGEGDDYYRIIRGHIPEVGITWWDEQVGLLPDGYRYAYITPNYNLASPGNGSGWELNINAASVPFKLWINGCDQPRPAKGNCNTASTGELLYMGPFGYQHRNALFIAGSGKLHQALGSNSWDAESTESDWRFFLKGKIAVAVKINSSTAALEVATIGVDYSSYDAFKETVKRNASLTQDDYKTSKGVKISKGYIDYGAEFTRLPFDRLEVWDGHAGKNDERKIVDWKNNVMTVSKFGKTLVYNFNSWTFTDDGSGTSGDFQPPTPPANVKVNASN